MTEKLIYIGGGALYNVPARDLTEADFADFAEVWKENGITEAVLLESGLYKKAGSDAVIPHDEIEERLVGVATTTKPKTKKAAKDGE